MGWTMEDYFCYLIPLPSGVPQGSALGHLIFVIYMNKLDVDVRGMVRKFADDTKIGGVDCVESSHKSAE